MKNMYAGHYIVPKNSPHLYKIRKSLRTHLDKNVHYTLGLSGGVDSLSLAAALSAEGFHVTAVVVDHQLQENHEEFTNKARLNGEELGLDVEVVKVDVPVNNKGMEANARQVRYEALVSFGRPVLIAHTMNDQVETVLMALGKNTGINSLTGMDMVSQWDGVDIIRPMLCDIKREDTKCACLEIGIDWWEDPQNNDTDYRRVAVRKNLLPMMKEVFGYDVTQRLNDTFQEVKKYKSVVDSKSRDMFHNIHTPYMIHTESILDEDEIVVKDVIVKFLQEYNVTYHKQGVDDIYKMVAHWNGQGAVSFKEATVSRHSKNVIMITPKS